MKKCLVTGGTGFIGSALVKRLLKDGHYVRVLDNNIRGNQTRLKDVMNDIDYIEGDIRNYDVVNLACEDIDVIHHLAYINGTEYFYSMPEVILEIAVKGIMNIIDAAKKHGVSDLYLASSSETYQTPENIPTPETERLIIPDPMNPRFSYGGGKILWELLGINYGRKYFNKVVIYRPHNVYGPDMGWEHVLPQFALRMNRLSKQYKSNEIDFPIVGSGNETRSFIYIDDFIDGIMVLMEKASNLNIYNIGTMNEISIRNLAEIMAKVLGLSINIIQSDGHDGGALRRCPDISKIQGLGFAPKVELSVGVESLVKWYTEHANKEKKLKIKKESL